MTAKEGSNKQRNKQNTKRKGELIKEMQDLRKNETRVEKKRNQRNALIQFNYLFIYVLTQQPKGQF
jgi:hypothetical protein